MTLEIQRLPLAGHPLARAYIEDYPRVDGFYPTGSPERLESYSRQAERIRHTFPQRWTRLAEAFSRRDSAADRRVVEVARADGFFVATGQQAGLFGGPLLTVYKALSAARLAEYLSEKLGVPVAPLFSVASEDHDWLEANHTHVVDTENRLVKLEVSRGTEGEGTEAPDPPIHRIPLGDDVETAIEEMAQSLPDSEHTGFVLKLLRDSYRPGRSLADAMRSLLTDLLKDFGVVTLPMSDPYTKEATRELLWASWEGRAREVEELRGRTGDLEAEGYEAQVPVLEATTNLFVEGRLGRDRVLWKDSVAELRRSGERLEESELKGLIDAESSRVSPGALLRPVAEARAYPVIAHVVGPSEIAYLAQSQVLFDGHGIPAPVVVPRSSFRLIEPKVRRVLEKYELEPDSFTGDTSQHINRLIKEQTPDSIERSLTELRGAVGEALESLERTVVDYDPGARSAVGSGKAAVFGSIDELESKLVARVKEKNRVMQQQLEKVAVNLQPQGTAQERVLSVHPYLARYGPELLRRVYDRCELLPK